MLTIEQSHSVVWPSVFVGEEEGVHGRDDRWHGSKSTLVLCVLKDYENWDIKEINLVTLSTYLSMRCLLFSLVFFVFLGCHKNIWNESGEKDPITGDWKKYCPPIYQKSFDGSCKPWVSKLWCILTPHSTPSIYY